MEWRDYKGYKVSDTGLVLRKDGRGYQNLKKHKRGYMLCHISDEGTKKWMLVHRIVAELFIPNPDNKPQVNHINGDKSDNCVSNLEWVTNNENRQHAVEHNLIAKGMKLAKKLTEDLVRKIKSEYVRGSHEFGTYALAHKYKVSQAIIFRIVNDKVWQSVNA